MTPPSPLPDGACGALQLCELPKGHEKPHQTSVDRAAGLDARSGYLVLEGPEGQLMRTEYRAVPITDRTAPADPREALAPVTDAMIEHLRALASTAKAADREFVSLRPGDAIAIADRLAARQDEPSPAHRIEYPSSCTGCEHLAAAFVAAAPEWMLVGRARQDEPSPALRAVAEDFMGRFDAFLRDTVLLRSDLRRALAANPPQTRECAVCGATVPEAIWTRHLENGCQPEDTVPPQTREARHTIGCECPCHLRTGVPCRDCFGQTREAEGAAPIDFPDYGDREPKRLLREDRNAIKVVDDGRRDPWLTDDQRKQPSPPSKADIDEAIRHRDERRAARTPEAQRDAPVDDWTCDWKPDDLNPGPECPYCSGAMCARIDSLNCRHDRIERHGYPAGQRDARNRAQIDVERLTAALRPGHLFEHDGGTEDCEARDPVAAREMAEEIVEAYAAATQPPAAGTEGGE